MSDTSFFLVRVWRSGGAFKASVRGIGQEEPMHFNGAQPLVEFLDQAVPAAQVMSSGPNGGRDANAKGESSHEL